jgi:hypothetical protein
VTDRLVVLVSAADFKDVLLALPPPRAESGKLVPLLSLFSDVTASSTGRGSCRPTESRYDYMKDLVTDDTQYITVYEKDFVSYRYIMFITDSAYHL